jgi:hypothetical protein
MPVFILAQQQCGSDDRSALERCDRRFEDPVFEAPSLRLDVIAPVLEAPCSRRVSVDPVVQLVGSSPDLLHWMCGSTPVAAAGAATTGRATPGPLAAIATAAGAWARNFRRVCGTEVEESLSCFEAIAWCSR